MRNNNMQCLSLYVWLISLNTTQFHLFGWKLWLWFSLWLSTTPLTIYTTFTFIYPFTDDGQLSWFHICCCNKMGMQVSLCYANFISIGCISRIGIDYMVELFLSFFRNHHSVFCNGCTNLHHYNFLRISFSPHSCQNLLFFFFFDNNYSTWSEVASHHSFHLHFSES
jgi:hypothetical protein